MTTMNQYAELPHYRAGAPPVPVPVRVSPERGGLRAQAEVRPQQVRLPLRPGPQPGQVQLRPRPQVHSCRGLEHITKLICVRRVWDSSQCACVCRATCSPGQELEPGTCTCLPRAVSSQCALAPVSLATSHPAKIATYVGLVALTVLGLTIAVTLYYIVIR